MTRPAGTFGQDLLARARSRGVTSDEVAALLALPVGDIRRLTSPTDLDQHAAATLRALAERLDLPWPDWLTPEPRQLPPAPPETYPDPARVHAVLAAAFGHGLHLSEIAHILHWSIDRVRAAVTRLPARLRPGGATRLHRDADTVTLELTPGLLDGTARQRLRRVLQMYGLGPDVRVLHLVHAVIGKYGTGPGWLYQNQDLIDDAIDHGLLTQDTDGTATSLQLHPDVQYSLGITQYRYPLEPPADPGSAGPGT